MVKIALGLSLVGGVLWLAWLIGLWLAKRDSERLRVIALREVVRWETENAWTLDAHKGPDERRGAQGRMLRG